jgi:ankyrin repeat protein|eukprot:COSAG02_NODE_78_length_40609_cov_19.893730_9_plen_1661_part_00
MGGGASKRKLMAEELSQRTTVIDAETQDIVAADMLRRKKKRCALALQVGYRGYKGRVRAREQREVLEKWAEELVRHPHHPLDGPMPDFYWRHTLRKDLKPRWDARPGCIRRALEHRAATRIQAKVRSIQTRQENVRRQDAALMIQRLQRGKSTRNYHGVKKRAATAIQAGWRGHIGRRRWFWHLEYRSATRLQAVCRMWSGGTGGWRCIKSALLVQRRYRYIRLNGNWAAAMLVRKKLRCIQVIQRMFRGYLCRIARKRIALEDNKMVRALLEDAGLSRMWSKWGDVFARPGSAYSGQFVRGDVPGLRPDGLPTQLYGGWSMTYDQMLDLRENQLGGMGLLLEPIPSLGIPKMPRVEWGMTSADRARLLGKIKPAKRAWIKNKHQWKAKEAAKKRAAEQKRLDAAATKIQARHRGMMGRRRHAKLAEEARLARVPGWSKLKKVERKHVVETVTQGAMTETALRAAARRGDRRAILEILETPHIKVDSGDENERTAFFLACQEGKAEIAKILLKAGADPEKRDHDNATPFIIAAHEGQMNVVRWLAEDVRVNTHAVEDSSGCNGFLMACYTGMMPVIEYIAEKIGVDVTCCAANGATPMYIAAYRGNLRLAKYLHRLRFNWKTPAKKEDLNGELTLDGFTPLEVAERQGHTRLVDFFKMLRAKEEKKLWDQQEKLRQEEEDKKRQEKKFHVPGISDLGLSRAEIRAIDMWLKAEDLNPFGDDKDHVYVKTFKGEFIKSEIPNGYTMDKASRLRYILKENTIKPWAKYRAEADKLSGDIESAWRKGKTAFQFGKRAADDDRLANTMQALQEELGLGVEHRGRPWEPGDPEGDDENAPKHIADQAFQCVVDCPANRPGQYPTRLDAVAGGHLRDTAGSDEPVSYLEKIDIACRAINRQAEWNGREDWIAKGGRTAGDLAQAAYAVWQAVEQMEEQEFHTEDDELDDATAEANAASAGPGINAARGAKLWSKGGKAIVSTARMAALARPKGPPRKLAEPLMKLPDRAKFAAYYDIITKPIDMGIILSRIKNAEYPTCLSFRNDVQQLFFNARATAGRGTPLWDDLNKLEDVAVRLLARMSNRLPYTEETWPEWNTIPPELAVKSAEDGTICSILYDVDDTIAQVKAKCEGARKNKLKCDGRRLIYNGQTLLDEQSISDLGIEVGTQLRLEPWVVIEWADLEELEADKLSAAWKAAGENVDIEERDEGSVTVRYVARETIDQVLSRVAEEEGVAPTVKQTLQLMDVIDDTAGLQSDTTLKEAGVLPGGTLRMVCEVPPIPEPEPDEILAATKIQAIARGWRARRAIDFVQATDCDTLEQACFKAVIRDDAKVLAVLIGHGADRNATNPAGHSMLELAQERGRKRVVAYLESGDLDFDPVMAEQQAKEAAEAEAAEAREMEEILPEGQLKAVMVSAKNLRQQQEQEQQQLQEQQPEGDSALEPTIHLDEKTTILQQQQEHQREMMERLQDPRVREAVSLEALHSRLAEHRRIMQLHSSGGWMSSGETPPPAGSPASIIAGGTDSTTVSQSTSKARSVSFGQSSRQWKEDVSANFTEWQSKGGKGRRRRERPLKRKHIGTLAALVAEPLFLVHAEQPGVRGAMIDPSRGNRAMHEAMRDVYRCVPKPRPPRSLPEPIQNMKGLENLWHEDSGSVHEALAKLEQSGRF